MKNKIKVKRWKEYKISGGKRANISHYVDDWFVGHGKDVSCRFEGTWWDMICFARNVLASENTKMVAPEYYKPEWANDLDEDMNYEFESDEPIVCFKKKKN